jgi:hypothetical protein
MATKKSTVTAEQSDAIASFLARKGIKESKPVSSASWKWVDGELKYFKVLGVPEKRDKRQGEKMEPPWTVPVKDLETGDHKTLILGAMLYNQLASFPKTSLIGKCFVCIRHAEAEGKDYKTFDTSEVPDPDPQAED